MRKRIIATIIALAIFLPQCANAEIDRISYDDNKGQWNAGGYFQSSDNGKGALQVLKPGKTINDEDAVEYASEFDVKDGFFDTYFGIGGKSGEYLLRTGFNGQIFEKTFIHISQEELTDYVSEVNNAGSADDIRNIFEKDYGKLKNICGITITPQEKDFLYGAFYESIPQNGFKDFSELKKCVAEVMLLNQFISATEDAPSKLEALFEYFDKEYMPAVTVWNTDGAIASKTKAKIASKLQQPALNSIEKLQSQFAEIAITDAINASTSKGNELKILKIASSIINTPKYNDFSKLSESQQISILSSMKGSYTSVKDYATSLDNAITAYKNNNSNQNYPSGGTGNSNAKAGVIVAPVKDNTEDKKDEEPENYNGEFRDIDDYGWAKDAIETLREKGIVNGVGNGMFAPNESVKREAFTTMIVNALNLNDDKAQCDKFIDVQSSDWFYKAVASAVSKNIILGIDDYVFGTGSNIIRQDVVVICERALAAMGLSFDDNSNGNSNVSSYEYTDTVISTFEDDSDIADYAFKAVTDMSKANIVKGNEKNEFKPRNNMTRAEAAVIIDRLMRLIESSKNDINNNDKLIISKLKSFGMYNGDESGLNQELTREECAKLVCGFLGFDTAGADTIEFSDCKSDSPYAPYIYTVCDKKYMSEADGKFRPTDTLYYDEAVKIAVLSLGEDIRAIKEGGYPNGYNKIANERGILNGINRSDSGKITKRDFIKLFDNMLNEDVLYLDSDGEYKYTEKKGDNFLRVYHGIYSDMGKIVANSNAGICGSSACGTNCIKIDNHTMINHNDEYNGMIGREVKYYYKTDNYDDELVYVEQRSQTKVTVLTSSDIIDFKDMQYEYKTGENRERKLRITNKTNFIYNDQSLYTFNEEQLNPKSGTVTLVDADGDNKYTEVDTVIINEYKNIVVSSVNTSKETIYDKYSPNNDAYSLDLSKIDKYIIKDKHGDSYGLRELREWDVIAAKVRPDKSYAELTLVDECYAGKLKGASFSESPAKITIGNRDFEFSKDWRGNENDVLMGQDVTVYWDLFGKVCAIRKGIAADADTDDNDNANEQDKKLVVLTGHGEVANSDGKRFIKSYANDKKFTYKELSKYITINGVHYKDTELDTRLEAQLGKVIALSYDNVGDVLSITTAALPGEDNNRGLWQINYPGESMLYKGDTKTFGNRLISGDIIYTVPDNPTYYNQIKKFACNNASFVSDRSYVIDGYTTKLNSVRADVVVYISSPESTGTYDVDSAMVVSNIVTSVNEDDEVVKVIEGMVYNPLSSSPTAKSFELDSNLQFVDTRGNIIEGATIDDLGAGDCIRYGLNDNKIDTVLIAYDYSKNYSPENTGGNSAYNYSGYAYSVTDDESYLSVALGVNPADIDISSYETGGKYINSFWIRNSSLVTVVDTTGIKTTIRTGSMKDIQTYVKTKSTCSKVFLFSSWQSFIYGVVVYVE